MTSHVILLNPYIHNKVKASSVNFIVCLDLSSFTTSNPERCRSVARDTACCGIIWTRARPPPRCRPPPRASTGYFSPHRSPSYSGTGSYGGQQGGPAHSHSAYTSPQYPTPSPQQFPAVLVNDPYRAAPATPLATPHTPGSNPGTPQPLSQPGNISTWPTTS